MKKKKEIIIIDSKFVLSSIQRKKLKKFLFSELKDDESYYLISFQKDIKNFSNSKIFHRKVMKCEDKNFSDFLESSKFKSRSNLFCFTRKGVFFLDLEEGKSEFFRMKKDEGEFVSINNRQIPEKTYGNWCEVGIFFSHGEDLYKLEQYSFDKGPDVFQKYTPQLKHWVLIYVTSSPPSNSHPTYFSSVNK